MAKKTPVKKSRRRLKRSVRRSLAAVLMVTAIGVAAIPVPENYAVEEGGISTYALGDPDVHQDEIDGLVSGIAGFEFDPNAGRTWHEPVTGADGNVTPGYYTGRGDNDVTVNPSTDFRLDRFAGWTDVELGAYYNDGTIPSRFTSTAGLPDLDVSLAVIDLNNNAENPSYVIDWQFMFYFQPTTLSKAGVICKYNDAFAVKDMALQMDPAMAFFTVSAQDIEDYFSASFWSATATGKQRPLPNNSEVIMDTSTSAIDVVSYTYSDYFNDIEPDAFLLKYYGGDVGELQSHISRYFAPYKAEHEEWDGGDSSLTPDFSRSPSQLTGDSRTEYFTDHCITLKNAYSTGAEISLVEASDRRPEHSGTVYLAKSSATPGMGYYRNADGFLITEKTDYLITAIGDEAFKDVGNVSNMVIPGQIAYIGNEAFMGATMLQSVSLNNVEVVGNRAFKGCNRLSTVDLGQSVTTIGQECFSGCVVLASISFDSSITKIGYGAFYYCYSLGSVSFPDNVMGCEIEDYAFYECYGLKEVSMENAGIIKIGDGAFAAETGSEPMDFVLPKNMKLASDTCPLGNYLFLGRSSLQSVTFPQFMASASFELPNSMFHGCVNLQHVEFPCNAANNPYACGGVSYDPEQLFRDIINPDFYVQGPKLRSGGTNALPRTSTWDAETAVSDKVPYLYIEDGKEFYEISNGTYLLCIDNNGVLTSCTRKDRNAALPSTGTDLEIPAKVGQRDVTAIASNCFSDDVLNQNIRSVTILDDSQLEVINNDVFKGWGMLEKVYIGNSVNSIGDNAFKDCGKLVDVTFASPLGGHEAFTIGKDAFTTQSKKLTFHGDIVEGYAPFKWAMDPDNIIQTEGNIRVCYQSLSPTLLTVMYNPITEMVTLLDYPKYNEISQILKEAHADEIALGGYRSYEDMKVAEWYARYAGEQYNTDRMDFAKAWSTAADANAKNSLYSSDLYGPWINEEFCRDWRSWINGVPGSGAGSGGGDVSGNNVADASIGNALIDWLFEPITAYAAEDGPLEDEPLEDTSNPKPYYDIYEYNVALIVDANDPYRAPTAEEQGLVYYTKNIEIPAGVQSIDVYGYINNLTADGEKSTSLEVNTDNYRLYLRDTLDSQSRNMYNTEYPADEDGIKSVPGLFSGYYLDGVAAVQETRERGNDVIRSVTMHTVEYLPDYAFDSCEGLTYVILGDACADIGKAPFRGCNSMTTVGDNKYYTTVNGIIYSVNSDGSYTIEECLPARGNLVGEVAVNASNDENLANVSAIKPGAFEDCDYLREVDFGQRGTAGLEVIPEDCFKNCDSLTDVVLPMTVNDVGKGAFVGAKHLKDLTIYGKEVKISGRAFDGDKEMTTVRAYKDSAVVRYVNEYGDEYHLQYDDKRPLGELWKVSFYDYNYILMEDMKDQLGNDLENPQYVENGSLAKIPQNPANTDDWTFDRWVGGNNAVLGEAIYEDTTFYARGYSNSGMVNGKYPVEFWDSLDGQQVGTTQYVEPGGDAIAPGHPVHEGFIEDGFNVPYTNIQAPTTVMMMYKSLNGGGTGTGTGTGSGGSTNTSGQSGSTTGSGSTAGRYTVTVVNGSGSGTYEAGATVIVAANTAPAGMVFQKWTTESSGVTFASVSMAATTFVMPANNVTVTANYVAGSGSASSSGSVSNKNNGTTGSGNGNTRVDILKPGISNKDLATATVNGSTDNFVVKISETNEATRAVTEALMNKYGSLDGILYYAMDISLYDSTGTTKISNTTGLTVDITIPIPDALVTYGGNNMAGAVINGNQLEDLSESFTTINGVPCIRFTATHFSPYTIFVDTGNLTEGMLDTTPKTGDPIHPKWFLSIGLACLSAILFMKKDKAVKVKTA